MTNALLIRRPYLIVDNTRPDAAIPMDALLQLAWDQPHLKEHVSERLCENFEERREASK